MKKLLLITMLIATAIVVCGVLDRAGVTAEFWETVFPERIMKHRSTRYSFWKRQDERRVQGPKITVPGATNMEREVQE